MDKPTAVPGGEALPVAAPVRPPSGRLGRTAVWLHGLAWLFLSAGILICWRLLTDIEERFTVLGVGGSAAAILFFWSVTLAVRGLVRGEPSVRPVAVIIVTTAELAAALDGALVYFENRGWCYWPSHPGVYAWLDWCFEWCLPLWLPFLLLTFLTVAPCAWWRVRRAEKKEVAKGGKPWERWRRGLALYGVFSLLLGLLLLPIPLVLYCGYTCRYEDMSDRRRTMVRLMPVCVEREALPVSIFLPDRVRGRLTWHLLEYGMLQPELLADLIWDEGGKGAQYSGAAMVGLWRSDPEYAQAVTDELLADRGAGLGDPLSSAGGWVGGNAPTDTVRHYLNMAPDRTWWPFYQTLSWALVSSNRSDLLPDLERCAAIPGPNRARFIPFLASMASAKDAERIWRGFAVDPDRRVRSSAAQSLGALAERDPDMAAAVTVTFLTDSDESIRLDALSALLPGYTLPSTGRLGVLAVRQKDITPSRRAALLKRLAALLDDPSRMVCYEATVLLSGFVVPNSAGTATNWEKLSEELRGKVAAELDTPPNAPTR